MMPNNQKAIQDIWDRRWQGSEKKERVSFLGKMMFDAKKRAMRRVLEGIKVKSAIEVGCGLGYTLSALREAGVDAVGIDISEHAVSACKKKRLDARLGALQDVADTYELVSSDGLLEHFLDFEPQSRHLMRISSKYVLLIQPNHNSFPGRTVAYLSELIMGRRNVYEYNYPIDDFIHVFNKHGFRIVENLPVFGDVFRLLLFKKGA